MATKRTKRSWIDDLQMPRGTKFEARAHETGWGVVALLPISDGARYSGRDHWVTDGDLSRVDAERIAGDMTRRQAARS